MSGEGSRPSTPLAGSLAPLRRNRTQQACEPCRRRKVACDHRMPVCQRCMRTKDPSRCIYLPVSPSLQPATKKAKRALSPAPASNGRPTPVFVPAVAASKGSLSNPQSPGPIEASLYSGPAAFLGSTSYSAVFQENQSSLASAAESDVLGEHLHADHRLSVMEDEVDEALDPKRVQLGAQVLAQMPTEQQCEVFFSRDLNSSDSWTRAGGLHASRMFWETYRVYMVPRRREDLEVVSRQLCRNVTMRFREEEDPSAWLDSFSGPNMRWEVMGILFTYWAMNVDRLQEYDPLLGSDKGVPRRPRQFMRDMKECAGQCVSLGTHTFTSNVFMPLLMYRHSILDSLVSGDSSLLFWRRNAELAGMVTALGLHRDVDMTPKKVCFASEIRRRIYAAAYNMDKTLATFTGRPPLLQSRYRSTPLPLDLSDEALLEGGARLADEIARLDEHGWNHEVLCPASGSRARNMLATVREEVLEIALGVPVENVVDRIRIARQQALAVWVGFPEYLKHHEAELQSTVDAGQRLLRKITLRLEHLQNLFLLERLLIKHKQTDGQELLDLSREMLGLVVTLWRHRDSLPVLILDFEWLSLYHAGPASGVLCLRLLKGNRENTRLARSETIQNLAVFAEALDWIKPGAPNANLCYRIRDIIRHVLDRVLDGTSSLGKQSAQSPKAGAMQSLDSLMAFEGEEYNLDLMDTFDWDNMLNGDMDLHAMGAMT